MDNHKFPSWRDDIFSKNNIVFGVGFVLIFVLAYTAGTAFMKKRQSDMVASETAYVSRTVEAILPAEHYLHKSDSKTTIIEYFDLECPHCQRLWLAEKEFIAKENPNATIILRHFPLVDIHKGAKDKAIIAECVSILGGEEKFFSFIDTYFRTQDISSGTSTFTELASTFIPNGGSIEKCLEQGEAQDRVTQSVRLGLYAGTFSTPSFVILDKGVFKSRHDLLSESSGIAILNWLK
jgi:protein-disulfide isomerase